MRRSALHFSLVEGLLRRFQCRGLATLTRSSIFWATVVGAALRCGSFAANVGFPHGDVHLDAATARSLAKGLGFWTPWEEGTSLRPDPIGATPGSFGHPADQHGPLWPLLGAPLTWLTGGDGVLALQIASLLFGILTIPAAALVFGKISARAGAGAAWACALALPLCDYSGNGSLYAAEAFGVVALPLVAGELDTRRRALAAGVWLGLLFLLNYQCIAVAAAFGAGVLAVRGVKGIPVLATAGAACLGVCAPWFVRNALVLGSPFYTSNPDYVVHHLGLHRIDLTGERPLLTSDARSTDIALGVASWFPWNLLYWLAIVHVAIPVLPYFAPGGFARLWSLRAGQERSLTGPLVIASFVGLLLLSAAWPAPKARYVVPLVVLLAGVGMSELVEGARGVPAAAAALATTIAGLAIGAPSSNGFPWREAQFLLPTLAIPALAFGEKTRKWLPGLAIVLLVLHGGFRVTLSAHRGATAWLFAEAGTQADDLGPPSVTFYEVFGAPATEGQERWRLEELSKIARRLREAGVQRCIGPVELAHAWDGLLVTFPAFARRFDLGVLPRTQAAFQADGLVLPAEMLTDPETRGPLLAWLLRIRAVTIYGRDEPPRFHVAYRISL